MPYNPALVAPMREEMTRMGARELTTTSEVDAAIGKHETKIIQYRRVVFIEIQRLPKGFFCVVVLLLLFVERALQEVHGFLVRESLDGRVQHALRLVVFLGALIDADHRR